MAYHEMPDFEQWLKDAETQLKQHHAQDSHHLMFAFPEIQNSLKLFWITWKRRFELGLMEMYAIEAEALQGEIPDTLTIEWVTKDKLEDYLTIHRTFAMQFGEDYADESEKMIRQALLDGEKLNV